jgi:AcrR family transcriptional regulator
VFGSLDLLMLAVKARTLDLWSDAIEEALVGAADKDRIDVLVRTYFAFAQQHRHSWAAIYEHHLPEGADWPDWYEAAQARLLSLMVTEVARVLPADRQTDVPALANSLLASVHGHCVFALNGTFAALGDGAPLDLAIARVRETIALYQN